MICPKCETSLDWSNGRYFDAEGGLVRNLPNGLRERVSIMICPKCDSSLDWSDGRYWCPPAHCGTEWEMRDLYIEIHGTIFEKMAQRVRRWRSRKGVGNE